MAWDEALIQRGKFWVIQVNVVEANFIDCRSRERAKRKLLSHITKENATCQEEARQLKILYVVQGTKKG